MTKQTRNPNLIEKSNYSIHTRETISILKGIDSSSFDKLVKGFGNEKEQNKIILSGFLNSTNVKLSQLGKIKIGINNIKNYIRNKPDISKALEKKIAKVFVQKLYESGATNIPFLSEIKNAFDIESKADIENKTIDFKTIQVNINKLSDRWNENINSVTISNDEIFDLMGNEINKITDFQSQNISSQDLILDILQFEVKGVIDYIKSRGQEVELDMTNTLNPTLNISKMFEEVKDIDIANLLAKKGKMEDLQELVLSKDVFKDKVSLKKYIEKCKKIGMDDDSISKLKKLLLGKVEEEQIKKFYKNEFEKLNKQIWRKYLENFENKGVNPEFVSIMKKLQQNNFDFSKLEKNEQSIVWQTLLVNKKSNLFENYVGLDQDEYNKFLKDLYDFEKQDSSMDIDGVGSINLHIKKNVKKGENKVFLDVENFKNMDGIQPFEFIVNIDDNTPEFIQDLESDDTPLRADGIMETHITKGGELNIGNGYELEICGKTITKSQLDTLLNHSYANKDKLEDKMKAFNDLSENLVKFGLYDEVKDLVNSLKDKILSNNNGETQNDNKGDGRFFIFEEIMKYLDVKVLKRNLIFEGQNINKLSQLYIMSKIGLNEEKEEKKKNKKTRDKQDEQVKKLLGNETSNDTQKEISKILNAAREPGDESGEKAAGEFYAEELFKKIKAAYEGFSDDSQTFSDYLEELSDEDGGVSTMAEEFRNELDKKGKTAFKNKLRNLATEEDKKDGEGIKDAVDQLCYKLEQKAEKYDAKKAQKAENDLGIEFETGVEKTEYDKFLDEWNKLSGDKSIETIEKGVRLYLDLGDTQLQPKDISDAIRSYYCFEVTNVDIEKGKFTIKAIGGDLKSGLVGKEFILDMNVDQLKRMKNGGDVFRVRPRKTNDWNSCLESINNAGFFKKITAFGSMEGQVKLDGTKFVNEKGEEIKYFDRVEGIFDDSKEKVKDRGQGQKIYKYEIKNINTNKGTVKIASNFSDFDENGEPVKCAYENEITFEQFILLMEGKRLKGYTELEQKQMERKYTIDDPGRLATKGMRKWISIGSIINVFKNTTKTIKGKIEERRKEQDEDLENYLFSQEGLNIYGKIGNLFGNSTIGDSARKLQYEFYTNRENRTWKRIEERYKIFQSDPNYSELYKEQLIPILNKPGYRGSDKDRYKFAAAFLMMVKKEGPCPRDFTKEIGKGNWVEKFLGPEHKIRFLNFYQKKKNELEQVKDIGQKKDVRLDVQEELNKLEYSYIINTIEGNAPHGPESNEFMLKSIWSTKFSGELRSNIDGYFEKHNETKKDMKTFYAAEEQYLRTVGAGRFNKAVPSLERMLELANTPGEVFRAKGYLLAAMLTGVIKNNSTKDTLKSFWKTARTIGFAPGYWIIDTEAQDKVKILLDGVTNGDFSKKMGFDIEKYNPGNLQDGKYEFLKKFQGYWNGNGMKILDKIEKPFYKNENDPEDKSIIDLSKEENNPNSYVFKSIIENTLTNDIDGINPDVNSKALYQKISPLSAISNTMSKFVPSRAQYSRVEKEDDKSDAESFWQSVLDKKCIPSGLSSKETTDFLFEKYFNRFNTILPERKDKIVRSIPLIQEMKKSGEHDVAKYMLRYMIKGTIHKVTGGIFPTEFDKVMNEFFEFFFDNIEFIDKSTIKQTFKGDNEIVKEFDNPYRMFNWKEYRRYKMNNLSGGNSSTRSRYTKLMNYEIRKINFQNRKTENYQEIGENDFINKHIEAIWKDCDKYGVDPNVNISLSNVGIKLNVLGETNDSMNKKNDKLDKLEEYYDSQAA